MIGVRNKRCLCGKNPSFNYKGKKALYCKSCKKSGMINVICKRCICGKQIKVDNKKKHLLCNNVNKIL